MKKVVILGVALVSALLVNAFAGVASAQCCAPCAAPCCAPCAAPCEPACPDCCGGCPCGGHCCLGEILHAPLDVVKWTLKAIGGGGCCCGCDQEVYWGDCGVEPDPCCCQGGCCGGGYPAYGGPIEGGFAPQSGMIVSPTPAPCNCNQGSPAQPRGPVSTYRPATQTHASYVSYRAAAPAGYPSDTRYSAVARSTRAPQASYASEPALLQSAGSPQYMAQPSYSQQPRTVSNSAGMQSNMYQPRLISVTDRVVKPAEASSTATTVAEINR